MEEVERALSALQARAEFLRVGTTIHTRKTTDNIHVIVRDVQRNAEQQAKDLSDLKFDLQATRDRIHDVKSLRKEINMALKLSLKTAACKCYRLWS